MNYPNRNISHNTYDPDDAKEQWKSVPLLEVCTNLEELQGISDEERLALIEKFHGMRHRGAYKEFLGEYTNRTIMDFGCGAGIDGIYYAQQKNRVIFADINDSSLDYCKESARILKLPGCEFWKLDTIWPYFQEVKLDIFLASGVLHHIPYAPYIMKRAAQCMRLGGMAKLLLYTDIAFLSYGRDYKTFTERMDPVGNYADWYDANKVERVFPDWNLESFRYYKNGFMALVEMSI